MIQIALVGLTPQVVEEGLRKATPDKLYIIHTKNEKDYDFETKAKELEHKIKDQFKISVVLQKVDAFDMEQIIRAILTTINKERSANPKLGKKDFIVNLTGGTKLMVAAAATAAYLAQSRIFYVHDPTKVRGKEIVQELPVPIRSDIPERGDSTRTTSIVLAKLRELGTANNKHLLDSLANQRITIITHDKSGKKKIKVRHFTGQILSYHLGKLLEKGLITIESGYMTEKGLNRTLNTIKLTKTGEYYSDFPEILGEVI